jgi:hypothetical protein
MMRELGGDFRAVRMETVREQPHPRQVSILVA